MEVENSPTKSIGSDFDCGICLFLMAEPATIPCGHKFCLTCIEQVLIYKSACPFCRAEISKNFKPTIDLKLQEIIEASNKEGFLKRKKDLEKLRIQNEKNYKLRIVYGNDHQRIHAAPGQNSHNWCAYVRLADPNEDISKYISKVTFMLHPTFVNPKIVKTTPPFEISCTGWGIFLIPITIEWNKELGLENTKVNHMLSFAENGDRSTFEVVIDKTLIK